MSEALAERGHQVDVAVADEIAAWLGAEPERSPLRRARAVALGSVRWSDYDVVKTEFHRGVETLRMHGGLDHPRIVSMLGSVVGPVDIEGVYFYGDIRRELYERQLEVASRAWAVTLLTREAEQLFVRCHGEAHTRTVVPGAAPAVIPEAGPDPYCDPQGAPTVLFAGNIYSLETQPEANRTLVRKLNALGTHLRANGARLHHIGPGDTSKLDREHVTVHGPQPFDQSWSFMAHADVAVVVSAGPFMHNNESTKVYHYLRAGLPVASESGFPNDHIIEDSGFGALVDGEDMAALAQVAITLCGSPFRAEEARAFILANHTWQARAAAYESLLS